MGEQEDCKKQLDKLRKEIQELYDYISSIPHYEYHLNKLKVDKVEGNLQLGKLIHDDLNETNGIHKIYVESLHIHEISSTGSVGLGITEKKEKKKKKNKVPPEKAPNDIKKIYETIKKELEISYIPLFYQELAVQKKVLQDIKEFIVKHKQEILSSFDKINKVMLIDPSIFLTSTHGVDPMICKKLKDAKEAQLKTWIVTILVLHNVFQKVLPLEEINLYLEKSKLKEDAPPEKILETLKEMFALKSFPEPVKELKEYPNVLELIFINIINTQEFTKFTKKLNDISKNVLGDSNESVGPIHHLSIKEKSFLFQKTRKYYSDIPKFIYIEGIGIQMCKD